jgi:hypothetical protein
MRLVTAMAVVALASFGAPNARGQSAGGDVVAETAPVVVTDTAGGVAADPKSVVVAPPAPASTTVDVVRLENRPNLNLTATTDEAVGQPKGRRTLITTDGTVTLDAHAPAAALPQAHEAHRRAIATEAQCQKCHAAQPDRIAWTQVLGERRNEVALRLLTDYSSNLTAKIKDDAPRIGVTFGPMDDVLRAQLGLPAGRGMVVTEVLPEAPAKRAGVEPHDVLMSVNGMPVATDDEFDHVLRGTQPGGPPLALRLIRQGKPVELKVVPVFPPPPSTQPATSPVSGSFTMEPTRYRLGISLAPADETLRKQLALDDAGLVVLEVLPNTPAERQGVRAYDVITKAGGRPVRADRDLIEAVQAAKENKLELELVRAGKPQGLAVAPEKAPPPPPPAATLVDPNRPHEVYFLREGLISSSADARSGLITFQPAAAATAPAGTPAEELSRVVTELEQLRASVEALRARLDAEKTANPQK